ncbi:MAG: PD-(D/E)XK nuclease family protein [Paludibacteraceae bacterium]|nr:PD-(D/E)XK nuclease family protein [Paludibacteraceae bacterium]
MKNSFLSLVAQDLIEHIGWDRLQDCTIVFPMQRAALFMKEHFKTQIVQSHRSTPVVLPKMMTIDQLVDQWCPLRQDEEIRSVCKLYNIYKKYVQDPLQMDAFYGWGQQMLSDFSNGDMALVNVDGLVCHTAAAQQLEQLNIDDDTRQSLLKILGDDACSDDSVHRYFENLWSVFPSIYRDFTGAEQTEGVGTRGARYRWVVEHWDELTGTVQGRTYVFVGFNYLLAAERCLMELLQHVATTRFYWDYNPSFQVDKGVYQFIQENIKQFGNAMPTVADNSVLPTIQAIACQSTETQSRYVHQWLLENHHAGEKTAIVIADESVLEQVIYSLPTAGIEQKVNITKGYPLHNTRIYAEVMNYLTAQIKSELPLHQILLQLMQHLNQTFRPQSRPDEESWQQVLLAESYYQTQQVIKQMTLLFEQDELLRQSVATAKVLRNLVRRKLEQVTIPFHGEPITDIQIIGILETRLLDFDHVLILNVEEGVVPRITHDKSFIPYDIRQAYHMQTREEEAKIYAYNFFRLLRRPQHVSMLFSDAMTAMEKKTMSRFLMQLLTTTDYQVQRYRITESAERGGGQEMNTCLTALPKLDKLLSPSAISDFIECKREFYLKHIAHLYEPYEPSKMLPMNVFGSLLHAVVEHVYRTLGNTITKEMVHPYAQSADLTEALTQAYAEVNADSRRHHPEITEDPYRPEQHSAENEIIKEMARKVFRVDEQIAPFTLQGLETYLSLPALSVGGKVDRLDIINDNGVQRLRILDYKTGGFDAKKMEVNWDTLFSDTNSRYALQTLIYCALVDSNPHDMPIVPELLYPRNTEADRRLQYNGAPLNDFADVKADFLSKLETLVQTILNTTDFAPTDQKTCEDSHCYCPFHVLCGRKKKEF